MLCTHCQLCMRLYAELRLCVQAGMLREQLTAAARNMQNGQSLSSSHLKGYSNKIQREAAKAVELPYTLVRGTRL